MTAADLERERRTEYMREYRDRHRKLPNGYGALVTLLFQEEQWQEDAACRGRAAEEGYDPYFQSKGGGNSDITRTKYEQCADCPVAFECFEYADRIDAQGGIWGGMDPEPRRHMVNRFGSAVKARNAHAGYIRELRRTRDRKLAKMNQRKKLA